MPELDEQPLAEPVSAPIPGWYDLLTEELIDLLAALNTRQQHAIRAIIEAGHYSDHPPAPASMIGSAPGCICTQSTWWGKPRAAKSGAWRAVPWTQQPDFMRTLSLAKRRALTIIDAADQANIRRARSLAAAYSPKAMTNMGVLSIQADDPKSAIAAAAHVFKYAGLDAPTTVADNPDASLTINWWSAAVDE